MENGLHKVTEKVDNSIKAWAFCVGLYPVSIQMLYNLAAGKRALGVRNRI